VRYYSPKEDTIIDLNYINQNSNQLSENKNRPIIILQMDFRNTMLFIKDKHYTKRVIQIGDYDWFKYVVRNADGDKFSTYIFDLKYFDAK
jgi:hypothetical protein